MIADLSSFLLVGIPETLLNLIIGLFIWKGRIFSKEKNTILKLFIAMIGIVVLIYFMRIIIDNIIITTLTTIIIYSLFFRFLWKANFRYSYVCSILIMFIIMISEITTMQFGSELMQSFINNHKLTNVVLIWSIPTRLIQIIFIIVIYKYNLSLKNNKILSISWEELSKSEKTTIHILLRHLIISIILNSCYSHLFSICMRKNIPIGIFNFTFYIVLLCSIYFLISSLQLLFRQTLLEDLKFVFSQGPDILFKLILESSNDKEIDDYQLQLIEHKKNKKGDV